MRCVKGPALIALLGAAVLVLPLKGPVALIKIPKVPGPVEPQLADLHVDVRQELGTCYLALAARDDLAWLRKAKLRFTILDPAAGRREIVVVKLDAPSTLAVLRLAGKAVAVEPGAAVFWTEEGSSAEAVPPGLAFKALSPQPVKLRSGRPAVPRRAASQAAVLDPVVEAIVAQVGTANLSATVQDLQDFQTRHTSTTGCQAAGEYLFGAFTALGLENVRFETFGALPGSRNVIAEKIGETFPDDILIVCAHYDSTSGAYQTLAPGADDNASGTAAVVEAARILAAVPLDFTVRFAAFSGEEQGLFGSQAHAIASAVDRIIGVINMDMIGYASVLPGSVDVYVNGYSSWLGDRMVEAAASYGGPAADRIVDPSMVYSDHAPFWDAGRAALLAIETDFSPYYHSTNDTLDKLNITFFTSVTKTSLGLLAELAQPVRDGYPHAPLGTSAAPVVYSSLFNSLKMLQLAWSSQSDAAGFNVYRSEMSHLDYVKLNAAPIAGTFYADEDIPPNKTFYYVVTAVGPTGLESNRSIEVVVAGGTLGTAAMTVPFLLRLRGGR
jgi:Peptidase family M28